MSQGTHPDTERLQGFAEASLPEGERGVVASHLQACPSCTAAVEEWRSLFLALSALPQLAPRPGFADRVLAGLKLPARAPAWAPLLQRAGELISRVAPQSTGGWALLTAFVTLPLLVGGGVLAWLFSRGFVTPATLWTFVNDRATSGLQSLGAAALTTLIQTPAVAWVVSAVRQVLETAGLTGLGAIGAVAGALTMLSIWILYRNLFRTPTRESNYVTYSF